MKAQHARSRRVYLERKQRRAASRKASKAAEAHRHAVRMNRRAEARKYQRQHPAHDHFLRLVAPEPVSSAPAIRIGDWLERQRTGTEG